MTNPQWPETTPRPWIVRVVDDNVKPRVFITREFGVDVPPKFYVAFLPEGPGDSEADANLIVRAVNALPEVEALCEAAQAALDVWSRPGGAIGPDMHNLRKALKALRQALDSPERAAERPQEASDAADSHRTGQK